MFTADVKWQERFASFALNRKLSGLAGPGVWWGCDVAPAPSGLRLEIRPGADFSESVAVVERGGYSLTLRSGDVETLDIPGPGTWYPVLEALYAPGQETYQALKLVSAPEPHNVVLGTVVVPAGATAVTTAMISDEDRTVGNPLLVLFGYLTAQIGLESAQMSLAYRVANLENWAKTQGYDPDTTYTGGA